MSFFEELKRRNVVRVGIAYGIASWVLLQVADLVLDNVEAPDWVMDVFMLVVVLGFLIAVVIAWAYEITPEGIKKESEIDRGNSITHMTGKKLDRVIILFLVLAVALLLIERQISEPESDSIPEAENSLVDTAEQQDSALSTSTVPAEPSIAVLPFVNMSADPEQEYFSDGISEELLNLLVRVDGLKVASRTSSFVYKGENLNIPAIASELKVNHVLEGSVRKSGETVRITAQLIDVGTDRHLWSDTYDRQLTDIFAIQDEISNAIVDALKTELGIGLESVVVEVATDNLDAYDLYLKARGLFIARQDLTLANELLDQITTLDPKFVQAWELMAASRAVSDSWMADDGIDHMPISLRAAEKALELDPDLSMAHAVIALHQGRAHRLTESVKSLDIAIRNDEKNASAWLWRGIRFRDLGLHQRAVDDFDRCIAIDPAYLNCHAHKAGALLSMGRHDEAVALSEFLIEENFRSTNDEFVSYYAKTRGRQFALLVAANSVLGEYAPIKHMVNAVEQPGRPHTEGEAHWYRYAKNNGIDPCEFSAVIVAFRWDHCYTSLSNTSRFIVWHPDAAYFRKTEEFSEWAGRTLLPYWREHGFPPQCRDLGEEGFECE